MRIHNFLAETIVDKFPTVDAGGKMWQGFTVNVGGRENEQLLLITLNIMTPVMPYTTHAY
jgi:hypothetical protein